MSFVFVNKSLNMNRPLGITVFSGVQYVHMEVMDAG